MDSSRIEQILSDAGEKLKKEAPGLDFFMILLPLSKTVYSHLSAEEKQRMEHTVISSAHKALEGYLKK